LPNWIFIVEIIPDEDWLVMQRQAG